jgi:hypothetical protein
MDTTTAISNKDALILLQDISLSANLQKSEDSILLAEDQYPENLDPIFSKSDSFCHGLKSHTGFINMEQEIG